MAVSDTTEEGRTAWCAPHSIVFFILLFGASLVGSTRHSGSAYAWTPSRLGPDSLGKHMLQMQIPYVNQ